MSSPAPALEAYIADVERYQDDRRSRSTAELHALHAATGNSLAATDAVLALYGIGGGCDDPTISAAVQSIVDRRRDDCDRFRVVARERLTEALMRRCACGCGRSLAGRRAQTLHATEACRKRAERLPNRAALLIAALRSRGAADVLEAFNALDITDRHLVVEALGLHGEDVLALVLSGRAT